MSSPLLPERTLVFSPTLAATIGLEEAVLLQVLSDAQSFAGQQGLYELHQGQIDNLLPFWLPQDIQRVAKSLVDKGIVLLESPPYTQCGLLRFRFEAPRQSPGLSAKPAPAGASPVPSRGANRIGPHWQPPQDLLLQISQHDIPKEFALAQLPEFITYWKESGQVSYSWSAKFLKHVIRAWRHHQAETPFLDHRQRVDTNMEKGWMPSADAVEILVRTGINAQFIEDAVPEFVLYWQERGDSTKTWNSKFIRHVKQQWARFTHSLKHDTEPRPIPADWQPDGDVYDILRMANIDLEFADSLVKEFVIYWRDSNQLNRSWNTKFLQHVKHHWANRHQLSTAMGANHAGRQTSDQSAGQSGYGAAAGFVAKHTDRSWADGL